MVPFLLDLGDPASGQESQVRVILLGSMNLGKEAPESTRIVPRASTVKESLDRTNGILTWVVSLVASRACCWGDLCSDWADFLVIA